MENKFAENIKELRRLNGLTQQGFAKKIGTTQRKVSYWELEKTEPDLDTLIRISEEFGLSIDELVKG